jgi:hypothetical protein
MDDRVRLSVIVQALKIKAFSKKGPNYFRNPRRKTSKQRSPTMSTNLSSLKILKSPYIAPALAAPLILSLSLPAPVLAATDLTNQGSAIGSGVYAVASLAVVVIGIIAVAGIIGSQQGKFAKGIELFFTVIVGVVIVGQLNSWGTAQAQQRTTLVAALFNGIGGGGTGTTTAMTADTLNDLMN